MEKYTTNQIRNIALMGHGGSGKTSLAEAMLYMTKATDRLGTPTDKNTVCDFDPEEIKRGFSISDAIAPVIWKKTKCNFIDTPGFLDFAGEVLEAVRVADAGLIVVDGKSGVEVGAELSWDYATDAGIPKAIFINRFDDPEAHFTNLFSELQEVFGSSICPILVPMRIGGEIKGFLNLIDLKAYTYDASGKHTESDIPAEFNDAAEEYRAILLEAIAQTSDELMEKFFAEEEITKDEIVTALHDGIINGDIAPVFCGSATKLWGIDILLDTIVDSFPKHTAKKNEKVIDGEKFADSPIETEGEAKIFVFKTVADQFGKMSYFKVMSGELNNTMTLKNLTSDASEKFAHIYVIRGKKQEEVDSLACGDIGMVSKLTATNTNDTLVSGSSTASYKKIEFPEPPYSMAVLPVAKGDEDKISTGINRMLEEDKTLRFVNNAETKQLVISGMGDMHLDVVMSKIKARNGVSVQLVKPKIAYRETIQKKVQAEGKHKKQSGGHGQYGHVCIEFGPGEDEGLTFTESVVGGAVPKGYFPAVEKGLLEAMQKGVLAGYPVVHLAANLFHGSYHDVDSSEMAFKLAANLAYKDGLPKANPVILEPIGELKVIIPDSILGDIMGDLNKRRGTVLGMEAYEGKKGYQILNAEVPMAEMADYTIALRQSSKGKGKFVLKFSRYEVAPANVAQKIIEDAKKEAEEQ